jgi:hypothetical protein
MTTKDLFQLFKMFKWEIIRSWIPNLHCKT